jgi:hypothetical protein
MSEIKKVKVGGTAYDIAAKYLLDSNGNLKDWAAILNLINTAKLKLIICNTATNTPEGVTFTPKGSTTSVTGTLEAEDADTSAFYLVYHPHADMDSYDEYVTNIDEWEKIGNTDVDLSGYVQKNVTYANAAQSNGAHTHTVTVPTVSVDKTKKLGATASAPEVTLTKRGVLVSVAPRQRYLVVSHMYGVQSTTTTASKATAGTAINVPQKTFTDITSTKVESPSVTTVKQVNTVTNGAAASFTQGSKAAWSANVDSDGVLSFSFTANGDDTFVPNTPTAVTTSNVTGVVKSGASTPAVSNVTSSKAADASAISIPQYSFADVTVPIKNANTTTFATGDVVDSPTGSQDVGDTVAVGIDFIEDMVVQNASASAPTITITEDTTNTGPVNEHVTTGTATATTSNDGAHTHNVNVSD